MSSTLLLKYAKIRQIGFIRFTGMSMVCVYGFGGAAVKGELTNEGRL